MWQWIYRLIAALLALLGSAFLSQVFEAARIRAQEMLAALAPAAETVALGLIGLTLLAAALLIAASPAAARHR